MLNKLSGFTLIEVLIALAILSIALTAIIKSTTQNIRDTSYLQNKTIANWVGLDIVNHIRAGVIPLSTASKKIEMLGQAWTWQASVYATPNPHIKEIHVDVSKVPGNTNLINIVSYLYVN